MERVLTDRGRLVLVDPQHFNGADLIRGIAGKLSHPIFRLGLRLMASATSFTTQLLQVILRRCPVRHLGRLVARFHFVPAVSAGPVASNVRISFRPSVSNFVLLRSMFALVSGLKVGGPRGGPVMMLSRFRRVHALSGGLSGGLQSVLRACGRTGCVFLNDRRSVVRRVFRGGGSPFCRFKCLVGLNGVPRSSFCRFLGGNFLLLNRSVSTRAVNHDVLSFAGYRPCCARRLTCRA